MPHHFLWRLICSISHVLCHNVGLNNPVLYPSILSVQADHLWDHILPVLGKKRFCFDIVSLYGFKIIIVVKYDTIYLYNLKLGIVISINIYIVSNITYLMI